jgi:hypothetical protein
VRSEGKSSNSWRKCDVYTPLAERGPNVASDSIRSSELNVRLRGTRLTTYMCNSSSHAPHIPRTIR